MTTPAAAALAGTIPVELSTGTTITVFPLTVGDMADWESWAQQFLVSRATRPLAEALETETGKAWSRFQDAVSGLPAGTLEAQRRTREFERERDKAIADAWALHSDAVIRVAKQAASLNYWSRESYDIRFSVGGLIYHSWLACRRTPITLDTFRSLVTKSGDLGTISDTINAIFDRERQTNSPPVASPPPQ